MKPWKHLVEADERARDAEREWASSGSEGAYRAYLNILKRQNSDKAGYLVLVKAMEAIRWNKPDEAELVRLSKHYTWQQIGAMLKSPTPNRINAYFIDSVFHKEATKADGSPQEWRVTGKLKTWKTRPTHFRLPLKYGMYDFGELTHTNADQFARSESDARR